LKGGQKRAKAHLWGLRSETLVALLLMAKGYRVLARRFAVDQGEVDLIVRRGDVIAFVEVKARQRAETAFDAVTPQKIRRLSTAARVWLARNPWANEFTLRGDLGIVAPRRLPRHLEDAYRLWLS
jgi:putative endonuclease